MRKIKQRNGTHMKKKIGLSCILLWELISIGIIYGIGGQIAPWIWCGNIFVIAPIACISLLVQIVVTTVRAMKHKKICWNLLFAVATVMVAYPITILFGVSPLTYPIHDNSSPSITIQSPVINGISLGGKDYKTHAVWPSECYAYDIVKEPYSINSNELCDYGIYLADVVCPVTGTVIEVKDTEDDILPNTESFSSSLGNYIYIEIEATGTYLILAHLEKNSIKVAVGDYVTQGMNIAKVGNSGTTSEPHLHIQHQRNNPKGMMFSVCAEGLPIQFEGTD